MERARKPYSGPRLEYCAVGTPEYERLRAVAVKAGVWPAGKHAEQAGTPRHSEHKEMEELQK